MDGKGPLKTCRLPNPRALFAAGAFVDGRDRGARNAHALGALFLRQSLVIEKPDRLELIQAHHDRFLVGRFLG